MPETQRRYDCAHSACEHSTRGKCSSRRRLAEQAGGWGLPPYRFTGKEEDVEVGLQYFGKRYLNPLLGRWMSADPLAVHAPGEADLNLYAYVSGHVLKSIDPLGLEETASQSDAAQMNASYLGSAGSSHTSNAWRAGQGTGASSGSSSQPAPSGSGDDAASGSSEGDGQGTDSAGAPDPIGEAPLTPAGPAAAASNTGATASTPPSSSSLSCVPASTASPERDRTAP